MTSGILVFVAAGFVAQMVDGALGMAYGVSLTSLLLTLGLSPAVASACVHTSEVFTSGVSGLSHWRLGNVEIAWVKRLLLPGVLGGVLGAYVLTSLPGEKLKPIVSLYLLVMGLLVLYRAVRNRTTRSSMRGLVPLGLVGGFCDAIGGGGWGPIVTTTLVARGRSPRTTVGSVNLVEFFVTLAEAATFFATIGLVHWQMIVGLILGGMLAAPLAAHACRRLPTRTLMALVGTTIVVLSVRTLFLTFAT